MTQIQLRNVSKSFGNHEVLKDVNLTIEPKQFITISGPSGSGKSSLLNILGILDVPSAGDYQILDVLNPKPFSKSATQLLRFQIGYLFQDFALLEDKTVEYNLKLALDYTKNNLMEKRIIIDDALEKVGLSNFRMKKISECSGGEQQRIAIARLLIKPCNIVLCDEPTGSLDIDNRDSILELLMLLRSSGKTVIVVTHDPYVMEQSDVNYQIVNGRLV